MAASIGSLLAVGWNNYQLHRHNATLQQIQKDTLAWNKASKPNLQTASMAVLERLRMKWERAADCTTAAIEGCGLLERKSERELLRSILFGESKFVLIEGPSAAGKSFLLAEMLVCSLSISLSLCAE